MNLKLYLQPGSTLQCLSLIGAFPGELDIVAAEVAVGGSFAIDGLCRLRIKVRF